MNLTLRVWRQPGPDAAGGLKEYKATDISPDMSFLEMLDVVNERLIESGDLPIAFDHDCREGICGSCGMMINGVAHGPSKATATCQLHMRSFSDGDTIVIEPWRARAFPVIRDLVVNRGALDRIIAAGGFFSAPSAKLRMWSWQVAVPFMGPWAAPLIISEHEPQMPSRQSWSKAIASRPCATSRSLTTSNISRNDISGLMSRASMSSNEPGASVPAWRQTRSLMSMVSAGPSGEQ